MKKVIIIIGILICNAASLLQAQDIFYPEVEPYLNANQKLELEKAVNILLKARGNENNANDIERKYSKLKTKGKEEAWRNKTWEAKEQRIMAEKNYKLAYKTISDVYASIITNAEYENNTYKTEALSLNDQGIKKLEDANEILSQYSEPSQEFLEQASNDEIDSTLHVSHILKLNGIRSQISALEIFIEKGKQAGMGNKEEVAWENAKKTNTISSYYEYLNNNPRGKHMSDANESITQLEKLSASNEIAENDKNKNTKNGKNNDNKNNPNGVNNNTTENNNTNDPNNKVNSKTIKGNLKFKVQIAAAVQEISPWMLNAKAPGIKNIESYKVDGWIKYMVGAFNSYNEAASYRDELRSNAPDAFIVVFENGKQIQVTGDMKK